MHFKQWVTENCLAISMENTRWLSLSKKSKKIPVVSLNDSLLGLKETRKSDGLTLIPLLKKFLIISPVIPNKKVNQNANSRKFHFDLS